MTIRIILIALFLAAAPHGLTAAEIVNRLATVTHATMQAAIADAKRHFAASPDDTYIIELPPGTHRIAPPDDVPTAIDLLYISPGKDGRLVIRGAGMNATTIAVPTATTAILGRHIYRVTVSDLHLTKYEAISSTQGHVVAVAPGSVTLKIQPGFPSPLDQYDGNRTQGIGRYLREYLNSRINPRLIDDQAGNRQIGWARVESLGDNVFRFTLDWPALLASNYAIGDLIAVKQKHGADVYRFVVGDDVRFERVKWTAESRGIFIGVDHPAVVDCRIERGMSIEGQVPALSTNGGGPQVFGKWGKAHGVMIANNVFVGTGDDSIGLFNVEGAVVNNIIADSFARGIYTMDSPGLHMGGNKTVRAPVEQR